MKITVRFFARFREIFGEEQTIETGGDSTPKAILSGLCCKNGQREILFGVDSTLHPHITVILNGRRLSARETEEYLLTNGDALVIYPPVSGG